MQGSPAQMDIFPDRVTIRVAPERMQAWREQANKERRSLSNWIAWIIEGTLEKKDQ